MAQWLGCWTVITEGLSSTEDMNTNGSFRRSCQLKIPE